MKSNMTVGVSFYLHVKSHSGNSQDQSDLLKPVNMYHTTHYVKSDL